MWSIEKFAAKLMSKQAPVKPGQGQPAGPPPLPPFPSLENRKRPARPWVAGQKDRVPDARMRSTQARTSALANAARIEHQRQAAYGEAIDAGLERLDALMYQRKEPLQLSESASRFYMDYLSDLMAAMVNQVRDTEVTTNFKAHEWFAEKPTSAGYTNMFERHQVIGGGGRPIDVARATQSGDPMRRVEVEEEKLIRSAAGRRGPFNLVANAIDRFGQTGGLTQKGDDWLPNNPHFVGASRPRYAALNYTDSLEGACGADSPYYGHSVLIWSDRIKQRATYCAGDSFTPNVDATKVCTYETIAALFTWMTDEMFEDIYMKVRHNSVIFPLRKRYIECHVYTPLRFREDLVGVRVSRSELNNGPNPRRAMANAQKFCDDHQVSLEWGF